MKILLFEDTETYAGQLGEAIRKALGTKGAVTTFKAMNATSEIIHAKQLKSDIQSLEQQEATLIVADSDLSKLPQYRGLSEPVVRRVADELAIPECSYARGEDGSGEYLGNLDLREERITVSLKEGDESFANTVVAIATGFQTIYEELDKVKIESGRNTPGRVLAAILGKSNAAEKIGLYASGDQNRLATALRSGANTTERRRRCTCLFGYWLWDSVLRYPGVIVNDVAGASYLNLSPEEFAKTEVQAIFKSAKYIGPFSEARRPRWWRSDLDDLISSAAVTNGNELVTKELGRAVARSECCEDATKTAGYYCMLSGRPVSLSNSTSGLTWFPRGADLARISKSKHEELSPWI